MSPPQFRTRRKDGTFQLYEFEYRPRGRGLDGSYLRPYLLFVQYWGIYELVQARSSLQLTLSSCSGEVIISLLARILPEFINWGQITFDYLPLSPRRAAPTSHPPNDSGPALCRPPIGRARVHFVMETRGSARPASGAASPRRYEYAAHFVGSKLAAPAARGTFQMCNLKF